MFIGIDPLYWVFAIPGLILGLYAQFRLSATYGKYMRVPVESGMSGAEAARRILDDAGLRDVAIEEVPGRLTDHYDPRARALFLSSDNFRERSVSAVGVAAHESGHALQHQAAYAPLNLRMAIVPVTQFASAAYSLIFMFGMLLAWGSGIHSALFHYVILLAIGLFAVVTAFQIITLPVEFDASRRAKEQLFRLGIVRPDESKGVNKVLNTAALTYVAAMISAVMQLLYLISLGRDRR